MIMHIYIYICICIYIYIYIYIYIFRFAHNVWLSRNHFLCSMLVFEGVLGGRICKLVKFDHLADSYYGKYSKANITIGNLYSSSLTLERNTFPASWCFSSSFWLLPIKYYFLRVIVVLRITSSTSSKKSVIITLFDTLLVSLISHE